MNPELKKIVSRMKTAQKKLEVMLDQQDWMEEARKYAEKQGSEVKKLLSSDFGKVKTFIERERKELERFQKQIPGEVKKFKTLLAGQRKELEKALKKLGAAKAKGFKKAAKKASGTRKRPSKSASATTA